MLAFLISGNHGFDHAALGPEALTGGAREMDEASAGGVSGLVFSILFSLVVIGAIVFLCWAHKAKVSRKVARDASINREVRCFQTPTSILCVP